MTVFAAVERDGRVKATVLPSRRGPQLKQEVVEWVQPNTIVYTDEWPAYRGLGDLGFEHSLVNVSAGYVTPEGWHTNTIEGFFGNLKTGIRGNYKKVSRRWLQGYLNEFVWRYNHRYSRRAMFLSLIERAASSTPA